MTAADSRPRPDLRAARHAYLGTSAFAASVLRGLCESGRAPALVVAPPDRPRGRGWPTQQPPVVDAAAELGLEILQTESVNEERSLARIRSVEPELATVCAFGQLIREPLLSELLFLNAHPSLLPRWRGAAPIERAIMAGDMETGVTIIRLVEALDAGPIALAESVAIGEHEDYGELSARLERLATALLVRALEELPGLSFRDQDESGATYAEKIAPEDRRLDPGRTASALEAQVLALNPHIGSHLELPGAERLGVLAAHRSEEALEPGELRTEHGEIVLGTPRGSLRLDVVRAPGRRALPAAEFLRGRRLPDRVPLGSPS